MSLLIRAERVTKTFNADTASAVTALRGVDWSVDDGEFVALVGPSGSGKTTFLNLIGALDRPTEGKLEVLGRDLTRLSRRERAELRLRSIGFVFQAYNLLPVLTAQENVEFILELQGTPRAARQKIARAALGELGLLDLADRRPGRMSGGQQQRVAVARAVASRPRLVLADEPTANLDTRNADGLMELMSRLQQESGTTFIFSTHDPRVIQRARRVVRMQDGQIEDDSTTASSPSFLSSSKPARDALPTPSM